jgi:hypothetical protein
MGTKRNGKHGRIDETGLSAETIYRSRRRDVAALLDWLEIEVGQHAAYAEQEGVDYGHCGDLGHVRELLVQALSFLAQQEPEDIESALDDVAAGREQAERKNTD